MKFNLFSLLLELFCLFLAVSALKDPSVKIENEVYVIDQYNYNTIVLDKSKDVLVMFYSPKCPYSRKLLPTFEELSKRFKSQNEDIIFAKFDGTDMDIPETSPWIELEEFPTLVLFTKTDVDKKSYYVYPSESSRTLASLAFFINTTSTKHNEIEVTEEEKAEVDNYDDITPLENEEDEEEEEENVGSISFDEIDDNQELTDEQIDQFLRENFNIDLEAAREEAKNENENEDEEENEKNYPPLKEDVKYVRLGGDDDDDIVNEFIDNREENTDDNKIIGDEDGNVDDDTETNDAENAAKDTKVKVDENVEKETSKAKETKTKVAKETSTKEDPNGIPKTATKDEL